MLPENPCLFLSTCYIIHLEASALCFIPRTRAHRRPGLASVAVIDRGENVIPSLTSMSNLVRVILLSRTPDYISIQSSAWNMCVFTCGYLKLHACILQCYTRPIILYINQPVKKAHFVDKCGAGHNFWHTILFPVGKIFPPFYLNMLYFFLPNRLLRLAHASNLAKCWRTIYCLKGHLRLFHYT